MNQLDNLYLIEIDECEGQYIALRAENPYKYHWSTFGFGNYMDHQVTVIGRLVLEKA